MEEKIHKFCHSLTDASTTCNCMSALMIFLSDITGMKIFVRLLCPMFLGAGVCLWIVEFIFRRYIDAD